MYTTQYITEYITLYIIEYTTLQSTYFGIYCSHNQIQLDLYNYPRRLEVYFRAKNRGQSRSAENTNRGSDNNGLTVIECIRIRSKLFNSCFTSASYEILIGRIKVLTDVITHKL